MTYQEIAKLSEQLSYRDKFRLAQLLIQVARKEEEEHSPETRAVSATSTPLDPELVRYVADRLRKLKPAKKEAVLDPIGACFLEKQRLEQRTSYDLEMLEQMGFVTGIENYSRHLSGRSSRCR